VTPNKLVSLTAALALGLGAMGTAKLAHAGMFDFMSPNRWFDNDRDRSYDRYDRYDRGYYRGYGGGPYGYGGPYGGGGGPYGYGGGYGPYGGGWGGYPNTIVVTPQGSGSRNEAPPPPPPAPKLPE
jgi:hypothetical protein